MRAIVVQGGAWAIPDDIADESVEGCRRAAAEGMKALTEKKSAVEAVERAVRAMEEDPVFDAGRGSVLNLEGGIEMDAMIMEGRDLDYGAVALVGNILHPVSLARKVMEETPHTFVAGKGANYLVERFGFERMHPGELLTSRELSRWEERGETRQFDPYSEFRAPTGPSSKGMKSFRIPRGNDGGRSGTRHGREEHDGKEGGPADHDGKERERADHDGKEHDQTEHGGEERDQTEHGDTVGACALDEEGNLAVALSTGGMSYKYPGRVGDSPLIGCGGYADNRYGAAAATGTGEYLTRFTVSFRVIRALSDGAPPEHAAREVIGKMHRRVGGYGGVVVLTPEGDIGLAFNTPRMPYAAIDGAGNLRSGI